MRQWGIIVSVFYALILFVVIMPGAVVITMPFSGGHNFLRGVLDTYRVFWIPAGAILASQALLFFLSVDTSQKRLRPRAHILLSCAVGGILTALLALATVLSLGVGVRGDKFLDPLDNVPHMAIYFWIACGSLWLLWGVFFYLYLRNSSAVVSRITSWLLKGSVLELLIAVPCHVIVRRRQECSAPAVTSFGIATGIAIMLLSFGPGVLFLYKKRLDAYPPRPAA